MHLILNLISIAIAFCSFVWFKEYGSGKQTHESNYIKLDEHEIFWHHN